MIVFKTYFQILKRSLGLVLMYTGIFLFFAIIVPASNAGEMNFIASKPKIAIINHDEKTPLIETFQSYMEKNCEIITVQNNETVLRDALFFREVEYIIQIPENFTNKFLNGENPKLETIEIPDAADSMYAEMLTNKYFQTANIYIKAGIEENYMAEHIIADLSEETSVQMNEVQSKTNLEKTNYFYNFINYAMIAQILLIIGMIMGSFHNLEIRKRNTVAPISIKKFNFELILANICVTVLVWGMYTGLSILLYKDAMLTTNGLLFILNSFVFMISVLTISFLIANLVTNRAAISAITNVLSLGTSFICGAFVPQMYLGDNVLTLAKVFPSYWFITNNDTIAKISTFHFENLKPILINMGIMLIYAVFYYLITHMVTRYKRKTQ